MTAATKPKPPADPPATFAEIAAKKMTDTVTKYRRFVERAAAGETLTGPQVNEVLEALAYMHLPEYAWDRDVAAHRDYTAASKAVAEATLARPAAEARLHDVTERIKAIEAELKQLKAEQYTLAHVDTMSRVGHMQRVNELTSNHPHVFADVETAARMRSEARAKATGQQWKPTAPGAITTWSIGQ